MSQIKLKFYIIVSHVGAGLMNYSKRFVICHTGINSNASLQQELMVFNNGQDFDGLEHFTYNNSGFVNLLFDHLSDTNFDGITVRNHSCLYGLQDNSTVISVSQNHFLSQNS